MARTVTAVTRWATRWRSRWSTIQHHHYGVSSGTVVKQSDGTIHWPSIHSIRTPVFPALHGRFLSSSSSNWLSSSSSSSLLRILPRVQQALEEGHPVVALESTLIAHGMPYPTNLHLYRRVANQMRSMGVEPATIALCNGTCRIGLTVEELDELAQSAASDSNPKKVPKCTTRDLPLVLAQQQQQQDDNNKNPPTTNQWGATTVASTMVIAHAAGIATFVTGGIGGVHREGETSMDVSADLLELSRTPVMVVSAGIKSILDIERTLQVLETYSVPTVSYQTDEFPAFFSPHSNVASPCRVDHVDTIARAFLISQDLQQQQHQSSISSSSFNAQPQQPYPRPGMLVAVPNDEPAGAAVEAAIQQALEVVREQQITGPKVTPFVLQYVAEQTQGASLESNQRLVERNAMVGAELALALVKLQQKQRQSPSAVQGGGGEGTPPVIPIPPRTDAVPDKDKSDSSSQNPTRPATTRSEPTPPPRIVVVGGIILDRVAQPTGPLQLHTSNPATSVESPGGVARNVAETLGRLGSSPWLYSAVGGKDCNTSTSRATTDNHDHDSRNNTMDNPVISYLTQECGVHATLGETIAMVPGVSTPSYWAILNETGDLHVAVCTNADQVFAQIALPPPSVMQQAEYLVADANVVSSGQLAQITAQIPHVQLVLEPTSVAKAAEWALSSALLSQCSMISPNRDELIALVESLEERSDEDYDNDHLIPRHKDMDIDDDKEYLLKLCHRLLNRMNTQKGDGAHVFVTLGAKGVLHVWRPKTSSSSSTSGTKISKYSSYAIEESWIVPSSKDKDDNEKEVLVNTTGAGDTFLGALLHARLQGCEMDDAILYGMQAAWYSLTCVDRAISPQLSPQVPALPASMSPNSETTD